MDKLDFEISGDIKNANKCLVFIHGWKGTKSSFKKIAQSFAIDRGVWILPQAPYLVEDQDIGYSWTHETSPGKYERKEPVRLLVNFFMDEIFSRFNSRDVFVFGFSQGGLVCYELIRILDKPLGGVFPIAGFMSSTKKGVQRIHSAQINTPVIIGHGDSDDVILKKESELAYELLSKESNNISLDIYKGGHKIGISYIKNIKELIENTDK